MQTQEILEVAGLLAAHAPALSSDQPDLPEQSLIDYWVASRCRFDSWGHDLRTYSLAASRSDDKPFTKRLFRLAVEIDASEVLARTVAALGLAHDTVHKRHESAPVTANVLVGHRDAGVRLNAILSSRDDAAFREVVRFRNLRTKLRALSDQLVACFLPVAPVTPFAHNPREAMRLGEVAASRATRGGLPADWPALSSQLSNLRHECGDEGPNSDQNHRITAAAMGLFAPEMFDSYGLLRTTWLRRIERVESETSVLVQEWLGTESSNTVRPTNRLV